MSAPQRDTQLHRPFRCQSCDRSFKFQCALDSHLQNSKAHGSRGASAIHVELDVRHIQNETTAEEGAALVSDIAQRPAIPDGQQNTNENISEDDTSRWSAIARPEMSGLYEELSKASHSQDDLLKNRYILHPYNSSDIAGLRKCVNCGKLAKEIQNKPCRFHPGKATLENSRIFKCCQKQGKGCTSKPSHNYRQAHDADKLRAFTGSPAVSPQNPKLRAVALDCEMVQIGIQNELIQLCAVDFLSGDVIINKLARPSGKVRRWHSNIHGITSAHVEAAISQGQALSGWKEAREELWKFIDKDTILVGHALYNDLGVLRIVHNRVVDSAILASGAVGQQNPQWGLETLCKELAGLKIRKNDRKTHDCLEDVMATREVVLWCLQHKQELEAWGKVKKVEVLERQEARKAAREKTEAERSKN